jgi:hypothetical protein
MTLITIIDEFELKGNDVRGFVARYTSEYMPGAQARGMTLAAQTIMPPIVLDRGGGNNVVTFRWEVPDLPAWWRQRLTAAGDPAVTAWWADIEPMIVHRARRVEQEFGAHV